MKTASITQTKNQLSALIDRVKRGETILILDRGKPVARMITVGGAVDGGEASGLLDKLERSGLIRRAEEPLDPVLFDEQPPSLPKRASALTILLEERERGR